MTKPYKGFKTVFQSSSNNILQVAKKLGFFDPRFLTHWSEILGQELALKCLPIKMTYDSFTKEATIFLFSEDLQLKALFTHYREFILNKIKFYFGVSFVTEVRLMAKL